MNSKDQQETSKNKFTDWKIKASANYWKKTCGQSDENRGVGKRYWFKKRSII